MSRRDDLRWRDWRPPRNESDLQEIRSPYDRGDELHQRHQELREEEARQFDEVFREEENRDALARYPARDRDIPQRQTRIKAGVKRSQSIAASPPPKRNRKGGAGGQTARARSLVRQIHKLARDGHTARNIAKRFDMNKKTVDDILRNDR